MINDEDMGFLNEIVELDGTEYGEYISSILTMYNDGSVSCGMSEEFKEALEKEIQLNIDWANENLEIEEYTVIPKPSQRRRLKDK